jgi:hypothetical protein
LDLRQENLTPAQLDHLSKVIDLGLEALLQGWLICGNISLLEGLRITYPNSAGDQARPQNIQIPYGCEESDFPYVTLKDSARAQLFYAEGVRALADVLARHGGNSQGKVVVDVDTDPIPAPENTYPGSFSNELLPQYTYYVQDADGGVVRIIPIQTECYMMGNLLQKQAQATQTIAYRLWTAAYFNSQTKNDASARQRLLDSAVRELHAGANLQFLASIGLASTVGDQAITTSESPYDFDQLRNARANINGAKSVIDQIRHNQQPTLPIDEVMAGDTQINNLITTLAGTGAGSVAQAHASYDAARAALFKVQQDAVSAFNEEQTRQTTFYQKLNDLTGFTPTDAVRTTAGQAQYRSQVVAAINDLLNNPNPDYSQVEASQLLQAVKQVQYQRQEVSNKKDIFESYPARIKIVEDKLAANISAINTAEGQITADQMSLGMLDMYKVDIFASAEAGVSTETAGGFAKIDAGVSVHIDPMALQKAGLQSDITCATDMKEIAFQQNDAAAQIQNLLLDQVQAMGQLKSQIILLQNAVDDANKILGSVDTILASLRNYDNMTATLFYNDPIFNQDLTAEEEQANKDLESLVANLYKLGKLLQMRWMEPFYNPITVLGQQPLALDPTFDNFWSLESVFTLGSVNVRDQQATPVPPWQQGQNFYDALKAWDTALRSGIRAFDGDLAPVEISLRQDIFGLPDVKTVNGTIVPLDTNPFSNPDYQNDVAIHDNNVRRFKNLLLNNGRYYYNGQGQFGDKFYGFLLEMPLSYYGVRFSNTPYPGVANLFGDINAWNFRVTSFAVKVVPVAGKTVFTRASTAIIFAQKGLISNIDFFERNTGQVNADRRVQEINLDNYVRYNLQDLNGQQPASLPYLLFSIAKQNNYPLPAEIPTSANMLTRFWTPFCSQWLLEFVPDPDFVIENIDDIVIKMNLTSGAPNSPAWASGL